MRTVTFSDRQVQRTLQDGWVACYSNTEGDPSAGRSFSHAPNDEPGPCGRGAGRQNVQVICMTPDNEIFHVSTGFLSPEDLIDELDYAEQVYDKIRASTRSTEDVIAQSHVKRLRQLGFDNRQITAPEDRLTEMRLSGPNPQDLGINVPKPEDFGINFGGFNRRGGHSTVTSFNPFGDISKQRVLKDHKFVINNPLMPRSQFEQNPETLVGKHSSFFGTHSGMNGIADQVNEQTEQLLRRGGR